MPDGSFLLASVFDLFLEFLTALPLCSGCRGTGVGLALRIREFLFHCNELSVIQMHLVIGLLLEGILVGLLRLRKSPDSGRGFGWSVHLDSRLSPRTKYLV